MEFIAPRSIESCCEYLETMGYNFFGQSRVYLNSLNQKEIVFNIHQTASKSGSAWGIGQLTSLEENQTHVTFEVGSSPFEIIFLICLSMFPVCLFLYIGALSGQWTKIAPMLLSTGIVGLIIWGTRFVFLRSALWNNIESLKLVENPKHLQDMTKHPLEQTKESARQEEL